MLVPRSLTSLIAFGSFCLLLLLWRSARYSEGQASLGPAPPLVLRNFTRTTSYSGGPEINGFRKPPGVEVIALVFYGRKSFVEILDCYLKRNLVDNGGWLDEVKFVVNTNDIEDLAYLDTLVNTTARYSAFHTKQQELGGSDAFAGLWEPVEQGKIYIKIDDDVVFFEDVTIPWLVKRLVENPDHFAVSANAVNNPALSWVHYSIGAYEPFFPELNQPHPQHVNKSWRPSSLPPWIERHPSKNLDMFYFSGDSPAPYKSHRWLPLPPQFDITRTPIGQATFEAFGPGLNDWALAAQIHYSFLSRLEKGELAMWKSFDVWDYHYQRLSINFIAIRGEDILAAMPINHDDEMWLTQVIPKKMGRHFVVDGHGLAVHFAFGGQRKPHNGQALEDTDLLGRYRGFAKEMVCPFPKQDGNYKVGEAQGRL